MLRETASQAHITERGWAPLPPLDPALTARLRAMATEMESSLVRHALCTDVGFDELWGNADEAYRRGVLAQLAALLAPVLGREFPGCRPILYNFFVKRASSPRSAIRFHQDFAIVDERGGEVALQLWIPLVDVTIANGALILVEGTHLDAPAIREHDFRHPLSEHSLVDLPAGAVRPLLRAGAGVVFTNRTLHGSTPNLSGVDRPAVGCILVPAGTSAVHWVRRAPDRVELWSLSDDDFLALQPGRLPPGARLVETVAG